jgi:hypothetical protein
MINNKTSPILIQTINNNNYLKMKINQKTNKALNNLTFYFPVLVEAIHLKKVLNPIVIYKCKTLILLLHHHYKLALKL